MRLFLGIILGAALTVGGAYLYDSHNASAANDSHNVSAAIDAPATAQRPMVNWDVVNAKWHALTVTARSQWRRVTSNIDAERATRPEPRG
jgi:hypothetical protein